MIISKTFGNSATPGAKSPSETGNSSEDISHKSELRSLTFKSRVKEEKKLETESVSAKNTPLETKETVASSETISPTHHEPDSESKIFDERHDEAKETIRTSDVITEDVRNKVIHLYEYIRELKKPPKEITDFTKPNSYEWKLYLSDVPDCSEWISTCRTNKGRSSSRVILSARKPDRYKEIPGFPNLDDHLAEKYKKLQEAEKFFSELFLKRNYLEQNSDSLELVIADGFFYDKTNPEFHHPVLIHKAKITYLSGEDTIQIISTDGDSELNESFIRNIPNAILNDFPKLKERFEAENIHPLDAEQTEKFLKKLMTPIRPDSQFVGNGVGNLSLYEDRLLVYMNPVLYVRKKNDGVLNAVEKILENLENGGEIPAYLAEIVGGGKKKIEEDVYEVDVKKMLASVGGEDVDILLSKKANGEQLKIAQRIEKNNAVLVQGPPGTGKTHTIANLLGHFLAQGKKILVTSHTREALSVMKDKVVPSLQNLCVSIVDDSYKDMESSIAGITEFAADNSSSELRRNMDIIERKRAENIERLGQVREDIYSLIEKECTPIDVCGKIFTPSQAASFVTDKMNSLSYIPGAVKKNSPMPLSDDELRDLYLTNTEISVQDEQELSTSLPQENELLSPDEYSSDLQELRQGYEKLRSFELRHNCKIDRIGCLSKIRISKYRKYPDIEFDNPSIGLLNKLKEMCDKFKSMKKWHAAAAVAGKNGGALKQRWLDLVKRIDVADAECEKYIIASTGGRKVEISAESEDLKPIVEDILQQFMKNDCISKLWKLFNKKDYNLVRCNSFVDGVAPENLEDYELLNQYLAYDLECKDVRNRWNELIAKYDKNLQFEKFTTTYPIKSAKNLVKDINYYLDWDENYRKKLADAMNSVGCSLSNFIDDNSFSDIDLIDDILEAAKDIVDVIGIVIQSVSLLTIEKDIQNAKGVLGDKNSVICRKMFLAIDAGDDKAYKNAYEEYKQLLDKKFYLQRRNTLLSKIRDVAPEWADAIQKREGVHGGSIPETIVDAWRWKLCSLIVNEIVTKNFDDLQRQNTVLGEGYRKNTAEYAEQSAWYHLLKERECDISLQQALQGWKKIVEKIGKGKGKNAARLRASARDQMIKCQKAVPAWIMPMSKVFEYMVPGENLFDIIIIDEASQADVSALAVLYMAKKVIIVGDDRQVSPISIGKDINEINSLLDTYLKNADIPNYNLYDLNSSVYDIAGTTFQPLMLREHFRCVPEIIAFSNNLSYDGQIKPMRDGGDNKLLPAVVDYHVKDGIRQGKRNEKEALNIVALMKACIDQEEYADATFGVISLLGGNEQVNKISDYISRYIEGSAIDKHKIACGEASVFQGDERDVIFLSLVDSADDDYDKLRKTTEGRDDSTKKRYNVAASRARNQMWVVHSLKTSNLQEGDLRKELIKFAQDSSSKSSSYNARKSGSVLEEQIAGELMKLRYNVVSQYPIGSYKIDMVIRCGNKCVALQCDGDSRNKGNDDIRKTMECQAVLERIGWRFIRVRGSEYFLNPISTIEHIDEQLKNYGINPEKNVSSETSSSELLNKVKRRAAQYLNEWKST